jgi:hypothetical protein
MIMPLNNQHPTIATLTIEMLDFWQAGSGRGEGQHLDSVPVLDTEDLPFLPGRTIKGLLRDAVWHLESIKALSEWAEYFPCSSVTVSLFGSRDGMNDGPNNRPQTRFNSSEGCFNVSDARLAPAIRHALADKAATAAWRAALFHDLYATAINETTGQAKDNTLRSKRVCVPMVLSASLETTHAKGLEIFEAAIPLIDALGSQRTRGLGRCVWSLQRTAQSTSARSAA